MESPNLDFSNTIGMIGILFFLPLIFSPIPTVIEGFRSKEIKNLSLEYFVTALISCSLWTIFGIKNQYYPVYICNGLGMVCNFIYMNVYYYIENRIKELMRYSAIFIVGCVLFYFLLPKLVIGFLALLINTCWHLTSIIKMKNALYTKNRDHINLNVVYLSFFFCLDFSIYSLLEKNYFLFIPNLIGIFLWGVNLIIYYWVNGDIADNSIIITTCFKVLGISRNNEPKPAGYIIGGIDLGKLTEDDFK
jgi:uncharacterized protein with PQ loop repeat